jgi:hypothetical protein
MRKIQLICLLFVSFILISCFGDSGSNSSLAGGDTVYACIVAVNDDYFENVSGKSDEIFSKVNDILEKYPNKKDFEVMFKFRIWNKWPERVVTLNCSRVYLKELSTRKLLFFDKYVVFNKEKSGDFSYDYKKAVYDVYLKLDGKEIYHETRNYSWDI